MKATELIIKLVNAVAENGDFDIEDLPKKSCGDNNYVDLGLPSGTLWAKCNYGALTETDYGEHYTFDEAQKLPINVPTKEQFNELYNNTTSKWVEDYNGTSVNGRLFTSKKNGNSIFIPASGCTNNYSVYSRGTSGSVWSSSLNYSNPISAWCLYFYSNGVGVNYGYDRCDGRSVRGVTVKIKTCDYRKIGISGF